MPEKEKIENRILRILHQGREITEINFTGCNVDEGQALIKAFAAHLEGLKPGLKVRVLTNFKDAVYDPILPLAWKSHIGLFNQVIERSAVIGIPPLGETLLQGYAETAKLQGQALGAGRAVPYSDRKTALDWLAQDGKPN